MYIVLVRTSNGKTRPNVGVDAPSRNVIQYQLKGYIVQKDQMFCSFYCVSFFLFAAEKFRNLHIQLPRHHSLRETKQTGM